MVSQLIPASANTRYIRRASNNRYFIDHSQCSEVYKPTEGNVVFKMESHNDPSYIEPYKGAGADVAAGILRYRFTVRARQSERRLDSS